MAARVGRRGLVVRSRWPRLLVRLLAFNLLLVFVPLGGVLYLGTYEKQLLRWQERSMVQQGRLVAAALLGPETPTVDSAERLLENLRRRTDARIRVLDLEGRLLADSSQLGPKREPGAISADEPAVRGRLLYRLGALIVSSYKRLFGRPDPALDAVEFYASDRPFTGDEVVAALAGRYGAATRVSGGGQRSVTLYSAIPIGTEPQVTGVVLVSQSTFRILTSLYEVRLSLFKVVLASLAAAIVLSFVLAATIVRPIDQLRDQAATLLDRRGRLQGAFRGSSRSDEIGDLARALQELTERLRRHLESVESFATDLSHELKNPLAAIRNAGGLLAEAESPEHRARFLDIIERDVARMEHLVSQVREVSAIDAQAEAGERRTVRLDELLGQVVEGVRLRAPKGLEIVWQAPTRPARVLATPERLAQVFENLLDNALSFSPPNGRVTVDLTPGSTCHTVFVIDEGPGLDRANIPRLFDRFFSYRPNAELNAHASHHTGLGLAIVKAIVESYGGVVSAASRREVGARFEVMLPADAE